jgi:hypothetical protein
MVPSARHGLHRGRRRSQWRDRDTHEWQSLLAHPSELVRLPVSWLTRMAGLSGPSRTSLICPRATRRSIDESQIDKKLIKADKLKTRKGVRGFETRNLTRSANQYTELTDKVFPGEVLPVSCSQTNLYFQDLASLLDLHRSPSLHSQSSQTAASASCSPTAPSTCLSRIPALSGAARSAFRDDTTL